ncbi:MAG: SAM-dependent methyltransferase [Terracidiphilus sp.]
MLRRRLQEESSLRVIDFGATSSTNVNFLTGLGHSIFIAGALENAWSGAWQTGTDEEGNPVWNVEGFLSESLNFSGRVFDVVLLWTTFDYLPRPLVAPVAAHLFEAMHPGGQVLAFFHTRTEGGETAYCRFHVTDGDEVEMQPAGPFPFQQAFTNRGIDQLFAAWSDHRQFLAKDSISELIITR